MNMSYYSILQPIYRCTSEPYIPFDSAYQSLWRCILARPPIRPVNIKNLLTKKTDNQVTDDSFDWLLLQAAKLGFNSEPIRKRKDPALVAAHKCMHLYASQRGVKVIDPSAIQMVAEQLRKLDNAPPLKIPIINLDVEERIKEVEKEVEVQTEVEDEDEREKMEDKKAILIAAKGLQLNILDGEGKLN